MDCLVSLQIMKFSQSTCQGSSLRHQKQMLRPKERESEIHLGDSMEETIIGSPNEGFTEKKLTKRVGLINPELKPDQIGQTAYSSETTIVPQTICAQFLVQQMEAKAKQLLLQIESGTKSPDIFDDIKNPQLIIEITRQIELSMMKDIEKSNFETSKIADFGKIPLKKSYTQGKIILDSIRNDVHEFYKSVTEEKAEKKELKEILNSFASITTINSKIFCCCRNKINIYTKQNVRLSLHAVGLHTLRCCICHLFT